MSTCGYGAQCAMSCAQTRHLCAPTVGAISISPARLCSLHATHPNPVPNQQSYSRARPTPIIAGRLGIRMRRCRRAWNAGPPRA
eukprot:9491336-Pyramimonas_sp.AAC.1